jgi:hypothetical protein
MANAELCAAPLAAAAGNSQRLARTLLSFDRLNESVYKLQRLAASANTNLLKIAGLHGSIEHRAATELLLANRCELRKGLTALETRFAAAEAALDKASQLASTFTPTVLAEQPQYYPNVNGAEFAQCFDGVPMPASAAANQFAHGWNQLSLHPDILRVRFGVVCWTPFPWVRAEIDDSDLHRAQSSPLVRFWRKALRWFSNELARLKAECRAAISDLSSVISRLLHRFRRPLFVHKTTLNEISFYFSHLNLPPPGRPHDVPESSTGMAWSIRLL